MIIECDNFECSTVGETDLAYIQLATYTNLAFGVREFSYFWKFH